MRIDDRAAFVREQLQNLESEIKRLHSEAQCSVDGIEAEPTVDIHNYNVYLIEKDYLFGGRTSRKIYGSRVQRVGDAGPRFSFTQWGRFYGKEIIEVDTNKQVDDFIKKLRNDGTLESIIIDLFGLCNWWGNLFE